MRSRGFRVRLLAWSLLLLPVALMLLYPIAQNYLRAASVLARMSDPNAKGWIANYDIHPVDTRDETFDFNGKPTPARMYSPRGVGFAPGIVVVHGMHELGINEPRLVSFARALAASGFVGDDAAGARAGRVSRRSRICRGDWRRSTNFRAATRGGESRSVGDQLLRRARSGGCNRCRSTAIPLPGSLR